MDIDSTATLKIEDLSDRHTGVTKALGDGCAEAASVCLHRYHSPPQLHGRRLTPERSQHTPTRLMQLRPARVRWC